MQELGEQVHSELATIKRVLATEDGGEPLPHKSYLNIAIQNHEPKYIDLEDWVRACGDIAKDRDCAFLVEPLRELRDRQKTLKPGLTHLVLTTLTCCMEFERRRAEFEKTIPKIDYEHIISPLLSAIEAQQDNQSSAHIKQAIERLKSQAICTEAGRTAVNKASKVDYLHPDENEQVVQDRIIEATESRAYTELETLNQALDRTLNGAWSRDDVLSFDSKDFEHLIADLWASMGYEVSVTKDRSSNRGGDQGVDVVATRDEQDVFIQATQRSGTVGVKKVRDFIGTKPQWDPDKMYFITTSSLTAPAQKEAQRVDRLTVIEDSDLIELLTKSDLSPPVLQVCTS